MRRDSRRANGSVGEMRGQQSEPVCFLEKKMEKMILKKKYENLSVFRYTFLPANLYQK
jgi:hypothetical protein